MKIRNVNKSTRILNSYQFGWLMHELGIEFTTRSFLCGCGPIEWKGWSVGKAEQLEGGDWRVEIEGKTELTRRLMDRFTTAKTY